MSSRNAATQKRILKSTLGLLEAGEGNGVRMVDIAKGAGITRQALYLHFKTRAELLIATTYYLDELKGAEERLAASRTAKSGIERLDAYVEAWGSYIPEIYGVVKALIDMSVADEAAAKAWGERMRDMKEGCEAAISQLNLDQNLSPHYSPEVATDLLWTMLSVRNWEQLIFECGWSQEKYIKHMKSQSVRLFVKA